MSIGTFFVRDVTIIHPALEASGYGDGVEPDYDSGTQVATKGWLHQLAESEQQSATRDAEIATHVLRLPVGTAISSKDQVVIDGQTFSVDGPPSRCWRPQGEHHVKASLVFVDG